MDAETERRVDRWMAAHSQVITRPEALRLGLKDPAIRRLVAKGRWRTAHPGVYLLAAGRDTPERDLRAALAALGAGAAASHQSAAWLQGLTARAPRIPHVTLPFDRSAKLRGVAVHRTRIPPAIHMFGGLPCTDPSRTLEDLAARLAPGQLDTAIDRALAAGLVRLADLHRAATPGRLGRRGSAALRRSLEQRGYIGAPAPSVLESRMLRLLGAAGLPAPKAEVAWGPEREYRLDFAYPARRLAIEVNGYVWHFSPDHQTRDHIRFNRLVAAGWRVLVYSWKQVVDQPDSVAGEIRAVYQDSA